MSDRDDLDQDTASGAERTNRRRTSAHYKANNEGGFGNPPVAHQFKAGGQGGPGRPPGVTTLEGEMSRILKGKVLLKNGGSTDYNRALAIAARDASLAKTVSATEFGFRLYDRFGPKTEAEKAYDTSMFSKDELQILLSFLDRVTKQAPSHTEPESNPLNIKFDPGEGIYRAVRNHEGHLTLRRIASLEDTFKIIEFQDEKIEN